MNKSWWKSKDEMDDDQKAFIRLSPRGKHLLVGPPGSGKTNLLLLRAQFLAGSGEKNVLIVTYSKELADFIRSGISNKGLISASQVKTYHSWAFDHILQHLGEYALAKGTDFDDEARIKVYEKVLLANQKLPSQKLFSAIFVDEAQDLTNGELAALIGLSDNVCICGDERQGIYNRDGLSVAATSGLEIHKLTRHFRIGQKVAHVADRLMPPNVGEQSLEDTSNYNPKDQGESSAKMHNCVDRNAQFETMLELIKIQLDAFKDDTIGIFCGLKESSKELRERFNATAISDLVCVHGIDENASFNGSCRIHVLTIHSAKGTEFRAVHLYGAEDLLKFPLNRSRLGFTAITRAKTALNAYITGETNKRLENAFSAPSHFEIDDLFPIGVL
jgi:superfamily I DNA/RNA helicase